MSVYRIRAQPVDYPWDSNYYVSTLVTAAKIIDMKTNIIRIGNSKGIRLPKSVLEQCRLKDVVEIEIEGNTLVLRPARAPRSGWSEAFAKMAVRKDDALLDQDIATTTDWDDAEWRW